MLLELCTNYIVNSSQKNSTVERSPSYMIIMEDSSTPVFSMDVYVCVFCRRFQLLKPWQCTWVEMSGRGSATAGPCISLSVQPHLYLWPLRCTGSIRRCVLESWTSCSTIQTRPRLVGAALFKEILHSNMKFDLKLQ